jgi:hypothetical protein
MSKSAYLILVERNDSDKCFFFFFFGCLVFVGGEF